MQNSNPSRPQEDKKVLSERLIKKNPNYVPIEIFKSPKSELKCFENKSFLIPCSFPFYLVVEDIRKRVGITDKSQALFCFVNKSTVVKSDTTIGELYNKFKKEDGFLYIEFSEIPAYG